MKKLYEYQVVQKYLIDHYNTYGKYASIGEILPEIKEYSMISDDAPVPRPVFYDWDTDRPEQLLEIYNHSYLDFFRINTEVDYWISENAYQSRSRNDVFVFLHFSHHKTELRRKEVLEFCYVIKGASTLYQERSSRILHEGDFAILGPKNIHDITAAPGSVVLGIQLHSRRFEQYFHRFLQDNNFLVYLMHQFLYQKEDSYYVFRLTPDTEIRKIVRALLSEFNPYLDYAAPICISYIQILFYKILQNYDSGQLPSAAQQDNPDLVFSRIVQTIYQAPQISLQELALQYHYSESHLSRLIHQKTGQTYSSLISSIRLERAKVLLSNTRLPISKVAENAGYPTQNHFSRAFRKEMGTTPTDYRNECQKMHNPS